MTKDEEIKELKQMLADLNNALNVLRQNNYSEPTQAYAEGLHKRYWERYAKYEAATNGK